MSVVISSKSTNESKEPDDVKLSALTAERAAYAHAATSSFSPPKFDALLSSHMRAERLAARLNASSVTAAEKALVIKERKDLLDKKFDVGLDAKETNRLNYLRWTLDRIEDAQHGATLDELEYHVSRYENLLAEIRSFQNQLEKMSENPRRK